MDSRPSLLRKIALSYTGYFAMAALIIGLSLITFMEMRQIELKILAGERISEFFDTTLEIRRYEKSYLLYGGQGYFDEARTHTERARQLLDQYQKDFAQLAPAEGIDRLRRNLDDYRRLMDEFRQLPPGSPRARELAEKVRLTGKEIVTFGEALAKSERTFLRASLDRSRTFLLAYITLLSLAMVAIGFVLWRTVVRPLQHMEHCIAALSEGKLGRIEIDSDDREIVSITQAFNGMVQELELRQRCLNRSEKLASLGTLLSGVAHELNNPLSNISTSCQILQEEGSHADADFQHELLHQIDEQTNRARDIVRALLDFSRDKEFRREQVRLAELIQETLRFSKGQIPAAISVTTAIPDDIVLFADKRRLQQAFLNLIKNAAEAIDGEGRIDLSALPADASLDNLFHGHCNDYGPAVDIAVSDSGSGIPAEILPRLFDPFFTTKEVGQGSGLGLAIAHDIVEEHAGCIAVDSLPGHGTTFHIRLPLHAQPSCDSNA